MTPDPKSSEELAAEAAASPAQPRPGGNSVDSTPETGVAAAPSTSELPTDPDKLREQIAETRENLGETVEALTQKADVKGQVKEKVEERKEALRDTGQQAQAKLGEVSGQAKERQTPFAIGAGALVALLLLVAFLRRR